MFQLGFGKCKLSTNVVYLEEVSEHATKNYLTHFYAKHMEVSHINAVYLSETSVCNENRHLNDHCFHLCKTLVNPRTPRVYVSLRTPGGSKGPPTFRFYIIDH